MPFDPTHTLRLRASFRAEGNRRVDKMLRFTRIALTEHPEMFGMSSQMHMSVLDNGRKLQTFADWFKNLAQSTLVCGGSWMDPYLQRAYDSGLAAAQVYTKLVPNSKIDTSFQEQARRELTGISEAMQQQSNRGMADGLRRNLRPRLLYLDVSSKTRKIISRLNSMCNTATVQLHNRGKLDEFRRVGMKQVGIVAERLPPKIVHDHFHDAKHKVAKKVKQEVIEQVNVLTAGDDLVCQECEDIADGGPYDIDEAEGLIPAHGSCRCSFVPVSDKRFASPEASEWF